MIFGDLHQGNFPYQSEDVLSERNILLDVVGSGKPTVPVTS